MSAVVRVQGDPAGYQQAAQDAVVAARPGIPIYYPATLRKSAADATWTQRFFGGLMASFAALALFLAALGIYGVMAYSVSQRTREIGVRMALGAPPRSVVLMVLRQGVLLVVLGLALGFLGAWFSAQLLASLLHGIEPHAPPPPSPSSRSSSRPSPLSPATSPAVAPHASTRTPPSARTKNRSRSS